MLGIDVPSIAAGCDARHLTVAEKKSSKWGLRSRVTASNRDVVEAYYGGLAGDASRVVVMDWMKEERSSLSRGWGCVDLAEAARERQARPRAKWVTLGGPGSRSSSRQGVVFCQSYRNRGVALNKSQTVNERQL